MKKTALSLLVLVLALTLALAGCAGGEKQFTVSVQGTESQIAVSGSPTVETVLQAAGIALGEKDTVTPALTEKPKSGDTIEVLRWAKVNVVANGNKKEVELVGGTVADALKEAGVTLGADEEVNAAQDAWLSDLETDIIVSKLITVSLTADGETKEYKAADGCTVEEFLKAQKLELNEADRTEPARTEKLTDGAKVVLHRVTEKTETVKEAIPFETKTEYSDALEKGATKTTVNGEDGEKEVTYKITLVDGEEESREAVEEKVLKEAVDAVVTVGTKEVKETGANGKVIVSKEAVPDCDGSGHGYYVITYEDGSVDYVDY